MSSLWSETSPGWCGSVNWVRACEPRSCWFNSWGCWFDSQSGHMPGLQARFPVGDAWEATTHWCFSPSLPFSLFSLKIKRPVIYTRIKVKSPWNKIQSAKVLAMVYQIWALAPSQRPPGTPRHARDSCPITTFSFIWLQLQYPRGVRNTTRHISTSESFY